MSENDRSTGAEVSAADPHAEYSGHREQCAAEAARWGVLEGRLSTLRLAVFVAGLVVGWLAFGRHTLANAWFVPPVVIFIGLLIAHDRVIQMRKRADRMLDFFERGIARLEDRWAGQGNTGESHRDPAHPYADDLDLFGEASLFELICNTRTAVGEATLAGWLRAPGEPAAIRARQLAVAELAPRLELRRDLAILGEEVGSALSPTTLTEWGNAAPALPDAWLRIIAGVLSGATLGGLVAWIFTGIGAIPFLFFAAVQIGFALALRRRVRPVLAGVMTPSHDLAVLAGLLARLEQEDAGSPHLAELRSRLDTRGVPPSRRIAELRRLIDLLDARRNQFFAPIGALLLWSTQIAVALESWRRLCGQSLGDWLEAAGEIEALCSLAGYAYEHPDDVFPEILDEGPIFEGTELGHPLIPEAQCVRNDVSLSGERRALMMSGSNMSGKSTLLRTVGSATLLAFAGAPVRASGLRISPLQVAASIRISDSLQAGASHFFAEITRLRQVVELTEATLPVLFLLDEVLHGTNSHDRRIGADAVVRGLIERGAVGIVTTHDLALARIADSLAPRIQNVHFQDQIVDGHMTFDYRLQPGVVTKSNAIELMRSVGLEV
jgi:hypothetical protein